MEVSRKKTFSQRKFVSVGLFFTLTILVVTGILIQIFETFEEGFSIHFFTAVHVFTGIIFTVFAILHTVMNWRSLRAYIKTGEITVSKETAYALLVVIIIIFTGFIFVHGHF